MTEGCARILTDISMAWTECKDSKAMTRAFRKLSSVQYLSFAVLYPATIAKAVVERSLIELLTLQSQLTRIMHQDMP